MRIEDCPKKLYSCNQQCPLYPCWAYEKQTKEKKKTNDGWE